MSTKDSFQANFTQLYLSDWGMPVPEVVPNWVLGKWFGCRVVVISCTNRVNFTCWRVRRAINPLICSLAVSWVNVWISETYLLTFSDKIPVAFSSVLPWSLIVGSIDVWYRLPFLSSVYSVETSIQVSGLEFYDELVLFSSLTKVNIWAILQKMSSDEKLCNNGASKMNLNQVNRNSWVYVVVRASYWMRSDFVGARWIRVVTWPMARSILTIGPFSLAHSQYEYITN